MLELRTLGGLELLSDGEAVRTSRVRETALLAYLACGPSRRYARTDLAQMFWPRSASRNALHCLSQGLYRLSTEVPGLHFSTDSKSVAVPSGLVYVDMLEFRRLLKARQFGAAKDLYQGDFLEGFSVEGAPEFEDWLASVRKEIADLAEDMFRAIMQDAEGAGEWADAQAAARALLEINPYDETAAATDVALLAALGQPTKAKARLDDAIAALTSVSRSPGVRLTDLAAALERGELSQLAAPAVLPLIGRSSEFRALKVLLGDTALGRGGAALILGKPGIGKTRLAEQAARLATLRGFRVMSCNCSPVLQESAYAGARQLCSGIKAPDLAQLPANQLDVLARLLPQELRLSPSDGLEPLPRDWIFNAVYTLLDSMANRRPLLIAVDDLQWLDRPTQDLLRFVSRGVGSRRIMITATARSDELRSPAGEVLPGCASIVLSELSEAAVDELTATFCAQSGRSIPKPATEGIHAKAGGHPFFLLELLRRWSAGDQSSRTSGDPLEQFMDMRLASLSDNARRSAEALAVLGDGSDRTTLAAVANIADDKLADGVDELIRKGLIRDGRDGAAFLHDLMRESTYSAMSETRRRMLHTRATRALSRTSKSDLCRLAFHANLAGNGQVAARYATAAARMTERRYGKSEAEPYWRLAAQNAVTAAEETVAKERLAACLYATGKNPEAVSLLDELLSAPGIPLSRRLRFQAQQISLGARTTGEVDGQLCSRILAEADGLSSPEARAEVFQPLLVALLVGCRTDLAERYSARIAEGVRGSRPNAATARLLRSLAELAMLSGRISECERYIDMSEGFFDREKSHEFAELQVLRACEAYLCGQLDAADHLFGEAIQSVGGDCERLDLAAHGNWGLVKLEKGNFDASRQIFDAVVRRALTWDDINQLVIGFTNLAALELERGDLEAAASKARQILDTSERRTIHKRCPAGIYGLAIMGQDWDEAARVATDLRRDTTFRLGDDVSYAEVFLARMAEATGDAESAFGRLQQYADYYSTRDFFCHARIQLEQARLLGLRDRDAGLALAREVRARASDAGAVLLLNRAEALIRQLRHGDRTESAAGPVRSRRVGGGRRV